MNHKAEISPRPIPVGGVDLSSVRFDGPTDATDNNGDELHLPERRVRGVAQGQGQYTVRAGDNLWAIAERVYGDGQALTLIRDANPAIGDGSNIFPGQTLTLPVSNVDLDRGGSVALKELDDPCGPLGSQVRAVEETAYLGSYPASGGIVSVTSGITGSLVVKPVGETCTTVADLGVGSIDIAAITNEALGSSLVLSLGEKRVSIAATFGGDLGEGSISVEPPARCIVSWSAVPVSFDYDGWRLQGTLGITITFDYLSAGYVEPMFGETLLFFLPIGKVKMLLPGKWVRPLTPAAI